MTMSDHLDVYRDQIVVCDLREHYLVIGRLVEVGADHLRLVEADLHDHREANSTKDVYLIETKKYGVRQNRARIDIPRVNVIAVCLLTDIVE